ncbi:Imm49 family immunity protein [Streptomyces harbinensis]|uniref:Imm49 family immunity protein n=1 Tax=Streptomyces harbinensis TaxID=1176198 RepID=UPI0024836425|nr:Imm49 family immunity protein [Streptomyces harbinensis]
MGDAMRHGIGAARLAGLDRDIGDWARSWQYGLEDEGVTPEELRRMAGGLLDRAAARTVPGTAPDAEVLAILETAAECAVEALSTGIAPDGDQEIHFPLTGRVLGSEDTRFSSGGWAPAARDWLDAFAIAVVSGRIRAWLRVIGPRLRDYARLIHEGNPYSRHTAGSRPADLAAMDALRPYLTPMAGHQPRHWPTVPLRKPDPAERAGAARALDATGGLTRTSVCCASSSTTTNRLSRTRWPHGSPPTRTNWATTPRPAPCCP